MGGTATLISVIVQERRFVHAGDSSSLSRASRIQRRSRSPAMVPGMTTVSSVNRLASNAHDAGQSHHQVDSHPSPLAPRYAATASASTAKRAGRLSRVKYQMTMPASEANASPAMMSSIRVNVNVLP